MESSHWTDTARLSDIVKNKGDVISVTPRTTISDAAKLLKKKNILSAPVWDEERREFVGIIDVIDLMTFAVLVANIQSKHHSITEMTHEELRRLTFEQGTVGEILTLPGSERRRMYVFQSHVKVANAMKILGHHDYRVLVMHTAREQLFTSHKVVKYRMLTQSDVIAFLCKNFIHLDYNIVHKRIGDLNVVNKEYIQALAISTNDRAIDGFFKMIEHEASACPVVDEEGRLVTNLSASDLRGLTSERLPLLSLKVREFFTSFAGQPNRPPPVVCNVNDYLDSVMQTTVKHKVHQVWIVDEQAKPIGVITLSDMILTSLGASSGGHVVKGHVEHFFDQYPVSSREG